MAKVQVHGAGVYDVSVAALNDEIAKLKAEAKQATADPKAATDAAATRNPALCGLLLQPR